MLGRKRITRVQTTLGMSALWLFQTFTMTMMSKTRMSPKTPNVPKVPPAAPKKDVQPIQVGARAAPAA